MADDKPSIPWVPPGNRALIAITIEYGSERVHHWLAEPRMEAFGLNPQTGKEYIIPVELWRSDQAVEILRTGKYGNLVIFVRDFDWPPDHVFLPPDEREGFPPSSAEPEPAVAPEEDKPAEPIEPGESAVPLGDDAVVAPGEKPAQPIKTAAPPEQGEKQAHSDATAVRPTRGNPPSPIWAEIIEPYFDPEVASNGRFPSLGKARDAVKGLLEAKGKAALDDRTIERWLNTHRPGWFNKGGA